MSSPRAVAWVLVLLVLPFAPFAPDGASAMSMFSDHCRLHPSDAGVAANGTRILVFGGQGDSAPLATIRQYDPSKACDHTIGLENPATLAPRLPVAVAFPGIASTGTNVFTFGGFSAWNATTDVIARYDLATGAVTEMGAKLPVPLARVAAVHDGGSVWLFGGAGFRLNTTFSTPFNQSWRSDAIFRYDIANDTVTTLPARLSENASVAAAGPHQGAIHLFGVLQGADGSRATHHSADLRVRRFWPSNGTLENATARIPDRLSDPSVTYDGARFHVFGGVVQVNGSSKDGNKTVLRYDPAVGGVTKLPVELVNEGSDTSALLHGGYHYVFGTGTGNANFGVGRFVERLDLLGGDVVPKGSVSPLGYGTVLAGRYVYSLGGSYSDPRAIVRYDTVTHVSTRLALSLPTWLDAEAVVWNGTHVVFLGSYEPKLGIFNATVWDPATTTFVNRTSHMPGVYEGGYAFDPRPLPAIGCPQGCAYIVGGRAFLPEGTTRSVADIYRYDVTNDVLTKLTTRLPVARDYFGFAWDGSFAYVVGGYNFQDRTRSAEILRFDPITGAVSVAGALPEPRTSTEAVWDGGSIYIYGGVVGPTLSTASSRPDILRFTPGGGAPVKLVETLPASYLDHKPVWTGTTKLLVSGRVYEHDHDPLNVRPVFAAVATLTVPEGGDATAMVRASDPEGAPVRLRAPTLPPNMTFLDHNNGSGTFRFRPGYFQAGTYDVVVEASDGSKVNVTSARFVVPNVDRPPVLVAAPDAAGTVGDVIVSALAAMDPDNDALSWSASGLPVNATLEDLGGGRARIVWSPLVGEHGSHEVLVRVAAFGRSAEDTLTLSAYPSAEVGLARLDDAVLIASPGDVVQLHARATNLGDAPDTFSFALASGWAGTPPASEALAPGASVDVVFEVVVPASGLQTTAQLTATSTINPTRHASAKWVLQAPVRATLALDDESPLPGQPVTGTVRATFVDGSPAVGYSVVVTESRSGAFGALRPVTWTATTDAAGEARFDLGAEPATWTPGEHVVRALVSGQGRADAATAPYRVG